MCPEPETETETETETKTGGEMDMDMELELEMEMDMDMEMHTEDGGRVGHLDILDIWTHAAHGHMGTWAHGQKRKMTKETN